MENKRRKLEGNYADDDVDIGYFRSYSDITIHEDMIADTERTMAYRRAILRSYKDFYGKIVLDVGAGTGILSMFCVHAGAKKVYSVEASDMAPQISKLVQANGMSDKITIIHGKVEDVEVPEKVDVIVSEWMGYFLLYESMLQSVLFARDKWLTPGGLMFPHKAILYLAPVGGDEETTERLEFWDHCGDQYKLTLSPLKSYAKKCLTEQVHITCVDPSNIMSKPAEICHLDLSNLSKDDLEKIQINFSFKSFGATEIHSLVAWFDVQFPDGSVLSTSPYSNPTHWSQSLIFLNSSLDVKQDTEIIGNIVIKPNSNYSRFLDIMVSYGKKNDTVHKQAITMNDHSS